MKVERERLLKTLDTAVVGITPREILEQSNSFVFTKDSLITFNGQIFTRVKTPLPGIEGAVPAEDFRQVLHKIPDEIVEVFTKKGEIRVKGKRKVAGITLCAEVRLPYGDVPKPGEWGELPPELMGTILQAARICGKDDSQPRTTEVHITDKLVEASDSYRMFRSEMNVGGTGLDVLIPAASVTAIGGIAFKEVSVKGGWVHFRTKGGHRVSLCCSSGDYPDLTPLLKLKDPKKVRLPGNLSDIISRAEVMHDSTNDAIVSIAIEAGKLTLRARKDGGWYKESRDVEYSGDPLRFDVNPTFLEEILTKTRNVRVGGNRMKISAGDTVFVVSLDMTAEQDKEDEE